MVEPNRFLNSAIELTRKNDENWKEDTIDQLSKIGKTDWGNKFIVEDPEFINIVESLRTDDLQDKDRIKLINKFEEQKTVNVELNKSIKEGFETMNSNFQDVYTGIGKLNGNIEGINNRFRDLNNIRTDEGGGFN